MPKHITQNQPISSQNESSQQIIIPAGTEQVLTVHEASNLNIVLKEGAKLTFILCSTEGWEGLKKITFEFEGRESELLFLGFIVGTAKNTFHFETISRHITPQTKAHYFLRAVMFDQSIVDYKGKLLIEKPAQLTDVYLAHHTLLLSNTARARTIPALEIEADDVKAGHAATIGRVDEELMFYLESRGIERKEAQQMLISGFFEQQLKMITDEKIQTDLNKLLKEKISGFFLEK